jgi:hypothetical protein
VGDRDVDQWMPIFPWSPRLYRFAFVIEVRVVEDESRYGLKEVRIGLHWYVDQRNVCVL